MSGWAGKRALVVGGSAGFGLHLAQQLQLSGAHVGIVARNLERLQSIQQHEGFAAAWPCDVTSDASVDELFEDVQTHWGHLDLLINVVGKSVRGRVSDATPDDFLHLFDLNFLGAVRCTRAALPLLRKSRGTIVNIGSLASKVGGPNLGAYACSKFPLAAYSQQLRLELANDGVHVLLVCPGPIRRADAGTRYDPVEGVPDSALRPGGGVKLRGIDPQWLARRTLVAASRQERELVIPRKVKLMLAIGALFPSFADRMIQRFTS